MPSKYLLLKGKPTNRPAGLLADINHQTRASMGASCASRRSFRRLTRGHQRTGGCAGLIRADWLINHRLVTRDQGFGKLCPLLPSKHSRTSSQRRHSLEKGFRVSSRASSAFLFPQVFLACSRLGRTKFHSTVLGFIDAFTLYLVIYTFLPNSTSSPASSITAPKNMKKLFPFWWRLCYAYYPFSPQRDIPLVLFRQSDPSISKIFTRRPARRANR